MMKHCFHIVIFLSTFFGSVFLFSTLQSETVEEIPELEITNVSLIALKTPKPIRQETKSNVIVAGQSVGHLFIGDSRERAIELFGRVDTEYNYNIETKLDCCRNTNELRFWELNDKSSPFHFNYGNGAWVYLRDDKIFQIKIQSEKFKTADGITFLSDPKKLRKIYPNSEAFVQLNTHCNCTGGANLIYWIDKGSGIAFEFHNEIKHKKKNLLTFSFSNRILIFYLTDVSFSKLRVGKN